MTGTGKARPVGINHVALEVGDIAAARHFYAGFLDFEIDSQSDTAAFVYFGDQFINFMKNQICPLLKSIINHPITTGIRECLS